MQNAKRIATVIVSIAFVAVVIAHLMEHLHLHRISSEDELNSKSSGLNWARDS